MRKAHNYLMGALFAIIGLGALAGALFFGAWHQLFVAFMAACMVAVLYIDNKKEEVK